MKIRLWLATVVCCVLTATPAFGQTNLQFWANFTFDWVKSDRLVYEIDLEPKGLLTIPEGQTDWRNLDFTPNVEYSPTGWADLVGEATVGYTAQTDAVNSIEMTPRLGARFHLFSRDRPELFRDRELPSRRRIIVRDLVRVEFRNFFYTDDETESSSTVRFRNRLEFQLPLNRSRMTDDGVRYLLADWEWFIPLDEPEERFASKQRIRTGVGYRHSFAWRFEVLYMWTRSRNTLEEDFTTDDNIINFRMKRLF